MIREALHRESLRKWQVITKFQQKPPNREPTQAEKEAALEAKAEKMTDDAEPTDNKPILVNQTLEEYEEEFNQCREVETKLFRQTIKDLLEMPHGSQLVQELYEGIETPFMTSDTAGFVPQSDTKLALQCV